jgi:hypothetical protein
VTRRPAIPASSRTRTTRIFCQTRSSSLPNDLDAADGGVAGFPGLQRDNGPAIVAGVTL